MPRTVLLVEDNPDERAIYSDMLSERGYRVVSFGDAERAVEFFWKHRPDVVVTDIRLPSISGLALMQIIRGSRTAERTPIIAISAEHDRLQEAAAFGCRAMLAKPFDPRLLVEAVARASDE